MEDIVARVLLLDVVELAGNDCMALPDGTGRLVLDAAACHQQRLLLLVELTLIVCPAVAIHVGYELLDTALRIEKDCELHDGCSMWNIDFLVLETDSGVLEDADLLFVLINDLENVLGVEKQCIVDEHKLCVDV